MRNLKVGDCVKQQWYIKCNDKIGNVKTQNYIKSSKGSKPAPNCNPSTAPPIGDSL